MPRAYIVLGALIVGVFGFAQFNYWSLYGSDAGTREPGRLASGSGASSGTRGK